MAIVGHFVHETQDMDVLTRGFKDVLYVANPYVDPSNPDNKPEWHEKPEDFMAKIKKPTTGAEVFFLAVENTDTGKIEGICHAVYCPETRTGLIVYPYASKDAGPELSHLMVISAREGLADMAQKHGHNLRGVFMEVYDPNRQPNADRAEAARDKSMYQSWDAREVGAVNGCDRFEYVQPPILPQGTPDDRAKADRDKTMMFYSFPNDVGHYPNLVVTLEAIKGVSLYGGASVDETLADPGYKAMSRHAVDLIAHKNPTATNVPF